jgi:cytochrome P450
VSGSTLSRIYYDPFDPVIDVDPHPIWERMREDEPVWFNERYDFYALSRFDDVWNAYRDPATFSSSHGVMLETLDTEVPFPIVIFMDPPQHDAMRILVSRAFTPKRIARLASYVHSLVDGYLDQYVGSTGFDFVQDFGALVPPMVIGEMLGVPETDRDRLRHWFDDLLHREDDSATPTPKAIAAIGEMNEYARAMIEERRARPTDDMVSVLMSAEVEEADGVRRLTEFEMTTFIMLLAGAGAETVARLLGWAAVLFARNPEQRTLLADEPSLTKNAVDELLRYEAPSPVNGRWTLKPFTAHGVDVPVGSKVLLLNGSANRDRREFADPNRFDIRRDIKRHISFGYGAHYCLGAALARLEGRIALEGVMKRFPTWEVDEDALVRVHTSTVRGFSSVPINLG